MTMKRGLEATEWDVIAMLSGGDRRSIGRANEVVCAVWEHPERFPALFAAILHTDSVVRMRAADAVEKLTAMKPELLAPYKGQLLGVIAALSQAEIRWHVAQMIPRLPLNSREKRQAVAILSGYLEDKSRIVQANAVDALAMLAQHDPRLCSTVTPLIERKARIGSAAVQARAQKVLRRLAAA
jgi:HEAT repeat protein